MIALVTTVVFYNNSSSRVSAPKEIAESKKPEQFIVLLDLSDRITRPGQIETDKQLIIKTFEVFSSRVLNQLCINSKDKFQICIAPQKSALLDKDVESEKLTLDMAVLHPGLKAKKLKAFKENLRSKLDELYNKAYKGNETKNYQGSNIWQFFNETLTEITSKDINTRLVVLTDGYFDFEQNNPVITNNGLSTSTHFLNALRGSSNWKTDLNQGRYGILPLKSDYSNLSVSVIGIRSKNENHLLEAEMLKEIWNNWLRKSGIPSENISTVYHGSFSQSATRLHSHLNCKL